MMAKYDEGSIKRFKGLDGVIQRPTMYLGPKGDQMVFRIIKEAVDNAYDEALAGRNSEIHVAAFPKENTYYVADKGQGIPVGKYKGTNESTLTLIMTELHTGGKFDNKAYKVSSGTHGIGIAAANAVCSPFEVWTYRDKSWHYQKFEQGKPKTKVTKAKPPKDVTSIFGSIKGTIVKMVPNQTVVSLDKGKTKAVLNIKDALQWLENLAVLNTGLKVTFRLNDKRKEFVNKQGPVKILKDRLERDNLQALGKPCIYEDQSITLALQWSSYTEDDGVSSYVSSSFTRDGGTHLDGLFSALTKALTKHKIKRDKFTPKDLRNGLIGVLNFKMSQPEFSSQVKDRLTSNVSKEVEEICLKALTKFFDQNKSLARKILNRATEVKKAKEELKKTMEGISKIKKKNGSVLLPDVLASAPRCKPEEREVFLTEGESASGTARLARNNKYQEILRVQGKLANAMRMPLAKLLKSTAIQNFLAAIGYDPKQKEPHKNLRVGKIMLLSDSDSDGRHINILELSLLYKLLPKVFEDGRVYVCNAPLFSAFVKNKRYFGSTFDECYKQLPKGTPKHIVMRAKGWGEVDVETLSIIAFEPSTRSLIKIQPVKGKEARHFEHLMSSDTAARKELLGLS